MLSWWLGTSQDAGRVNNENPEIEPPETPAPVFAARALKSALFGTPAPLHEDDTTYRIDKLADRISEKGSRNLQNVNASPAKPQGILLTPGTATTRRKTVSFGTEVVDNEKNEGEKSGGKGGVPSKSVSESDPGSSSRKTSLTKILESSREGKAPKIRSSRHRSPLGPDAFDDVCTVVDVELPKAVQLDAKKPNKLEIGNQDLLREMIEGDMTMDLNEPHSQSGKYWKAEFEKYHEDAKVEMRKLVKYKQLATTFAMKKDAEAIDLAGKLEEEQKRVITMEENIAKLIIQIANKEDGADKEGPELVKELECQTALAAQYRSGVEEFQSALERKESGVNTREGQTAQRFASPRTEQTLLETHKELKKARGQLKQMTLLQEELQNIRQSLSAAEKTAEKLREENNKLSQDLTNSNLRMEKHLEKCEKRQNSLEEHRKKKDGELQNLRKDYDALKEMAKSQRKDAEHLLKKRHDQVVELKKDIANLKSADPTGDELQQAMAKMAIEHDQVIRDYQKQVSILLGEKKSRSKDKLRLEKKENARQPGSTSSNLPTTEISHPRESGIPILTTSTRSLRNVASTREARPEPATPAVCSSQPALAEVTNTASVEKFPSQQSGPVQFTPLASRFSSMSLESPMPELPAPEPSLPNPTSRALREKRYLTSPRPSMFNLASSPPKQGLLRSQTSGDVLIQQLNSEARRQESLASSRLPSTETSRIRTALPPERAAAAKARLEQKLAEKRRIKALEAEKENVKN